MDYPGCPAVGKPFATYRSWRESSVEHPVNGVFILRGITTLPRLRPMWIALTIIRCLALDPAVTPVHQDAHASRSNSLFLPGVAVGAPSAAWRNTPDSAPGPSPYASWPCSRVASRDPPTSAVRLHPPSRRRIPAAG